MQGLFETSLLYLSILILFVKLEIWYSDIIQHTQHKQTHTVQIQTDTLVKLDFVLTTNAVDRLVGHPILLYG